MRSKKQGLSLLEAGGMTKEELARVTDKEALGYTVWCSLTASSAHASLAESAGARWSSTSGRRRRRRGARGWPEAQGILWARHVEARQLLRGDEESCTSELPLVAAMAHDGTGIKLDEQTRFSNPVIGERLGQLSQITSCDSLEERRHRLRGGGSGDGSHSSRSISALAQWRPGGCGRRAVRPVPRDARCRVRAID